MKLCGQLPETLLMAFEQSVFQLLLKHRNEVMRSFELKVPAKLREQRMWVKQWMKD
jgi:hypothetical protein